MSIQDLEPKFYVQLTVCEEKLTQAVQKSTKPEAMDTHVTKYHVTKFITAITPAITLSTASPWKAIAFWPLRWSVFALKEMV